MASEVFFHRVPYTQRRIPPHQQHDPFSTNTASSSTASASAAANTTHLHRSVGTSRSGGALTFPPLYLDPVDPHSNDPSNNPNSGNNGQQPGSFILGSTFYHHPELNALVSNHLIDASADALDGATGTGHAFLSNIFSNRDGGNDDDSDADEAGVHGVDGAVAVPRPKIASEFVSLNEDLVPASLDMHGDMLPADQHPSYPFGNLFGPLGGMIAADSAIVGGGNGTHGAASSGGALGTGLADSAGAALGFDFGGGLDGLINLGQSSHGRRSAVSNAWNNFINKASRTKLVGSAAAHTEWNLDETQTATTSTSNAAPWWGEKDDQTKTKETIRSAKKLDLSPSLLFRTNTSTVLAPPTWPFRRHGPGCTSYAALLRPSSNIFGSSPASQAVAATLGGLPASSNIIKEVWSDLALEELVPTRIGETSATRHLNTNESLDAESDAEGASEKRSKKRRRKLDAEPDNVFAKRIAAMEADPLDLLGPISREIRGQAARPWGTATSSASRRPNRRRRRNSGYSNQSEDEAAEAEHDDPDQGYTQRDRLRYSFTLPPANFSWMESPPPDDEEERRSQDDTLHVEPDSIGWSTAKRIFVNEERDRLLPEVASRAVGASGGIEAYRVRGVRANQGLLPRPAWTWTDGPVGETEPEAGEMSFATEMSGSTSHQTDLHASRQNGQQRGNVQDSDSEQRYLGQGDADEDEDRDRGEDGSWQYSSEDAEMQRALLAQYGAGTADGAQAYDEDDDVQDDDEEDGLSEKGKEADEEDGEQIAAEEDEDVGTFEEEQEAL